MTQPTQPTEQEIKLIKKARLLIESFLKSADNEYGLLYQAVGLLEALSNDD